MKTKFCIYTNDYKKSHNLKAKLTKELTALGYEVSDDATNIIVLGGDGTFVHAFNKFADKKVKLLLINTGFVGFYALHGKPSAKDIVAIFADKKNFFSPDVVVFENGKEKYIGLNDITFQAVNTVTCDIAINNFFYEKFRGSGLCFSTKTGCTGYNKSLGGALILTRSRVWQMCEIAPIAHARYLSFKNSVVFDHKKVVTINNFKSNGSLMLLNDGIEHEIDLKLPAKVYLSKSIAQINCLNNMEHYVEKLQKVYIIGEKK